MDYNIQIDFQLLETTILPSEISQKIGFSPEVELVKGERNPKLGLPRTNIWSIRSHAKSDEVVDHWNDLAKKLETVKFTLIINSSDRIPSLIIPPEMSSFAGFVGAVIDVDHYL